MHERRITMAESKPKRTFDVFTRKWAFLLILSASPLYILFAYFGNPARGLAAYVCGGAIAFAVRYFWDLRKRFWFWITVTIIVYLHVLLIMHSSWLEERWNLIQRWNYMQALPFALLDFAIVFGVVSLIESVIEKIS